MQKDVVHLAFDDQNPEIRGIGNLIYGTGWIAAFIFFVGLFSFFGSMVAESSVSGPLPPGPTPPPTAPPMQSLMAAIVQSYIYSAELLIKLFIVLIALIVMLIYGVYRTYKGLSYLGGYVPHTGIGRAGAILDAVPPLMLVGNILLGTSLFLVGSKYKNAGLKVGGIMTAIPYPLLGFAGGAPIVALLSMMWFIGLVVAYSGGRSILKRYYRVGQQPDARLNRLHIANRVLEAGSALVLLSTLFDLGLMAGLLKGAYYISDLSTFGLVAITGLVMTVLAIYFSIRLSKLYSSARSGTLSDVSAVHRTGIVLLILSIIGLFVIGLFFINGSFIGFIFLILLILLLSGSFIGFILLLVGSILAITWKP